MQTFPCGLPEAAAITPAGKECLEDVRGRGLDEIGSAGADERDGQL
jgi:hypothetical protein